jgi:excisionase family DNA binding protein
MPVSSKTPPSRFPARKPRFFSVAEVSIILKLTTQEVEALIEKKELMGIRGGTEGRTFRVRSEDLETYIRRSRVARE